jgi:hypothetical protein
MPTVGKIFIWSVFVVYNLGALSSMYILVKRADYFLNNPKNGEIIISTLFLGSMISVIFIVSVLGVAA